jgi:hypothetical protein
MLHLFFLLYLHQYVVYNSKALIKVISPPSKTPLSLNDLFYEQKIYITF